MSGCEKIFRILGSILPIDAYKKIYDYTNINKSLFPKLVFELNNITFMREIIGNYSLPQVNEIDTEFVSTWIEIYS